jgi:hypothetical protein
VAHGALGDHGSLTADQLAAQLSGQGRAATRATIDRALAELMAADVAAIDLQTQRWTLRPATQHPLLEAVDLHGAHDFRHTCSTWLEDAGIPARVIDELMATSPAGGPAAMRPAPSGPTTATPPPRWPPAWSPRSRSAWSLSWRRRRPLSISNPGDATRWSGHCASFAGRLLADDAQSGGGRREVPGGAEGI